MKVSTTWAIASLALLAALNTPLEAQQNPEARLNALFQPDQREVYVAAHRGDWRDAPENSIYSLQHAARLGVDIAEMDVKKTIDGHLVVMHDTMLDRTTTGSGAISSYSLEQIEGFHLRAGTAHPTPYRIPTFPEELAAAHGNVILDVDQGWGYFSDVLKDVRAAGMIGEVIVNVLPNTSYDAFQKQEGAVPENLAIMIVVNMARPDAEDIIWSYRKHKRTIIQCIFDDDQLPSVQHVALYRQQFPVWINSLWPEQNAAHDDERAVEQKEQDQSWGWQISHGANLLQTDRPREMMEYLRQRKLHQ